MMKVNYSVLLILIVLAGCSMQPLETPEYNDEQNKENPEESDIPDLESVSEELNTNSLENLEEDLDYIENI